MRKSTNVQKDIQLDPASVQRLQWVTHYLKHEAQAPPHLLRPSSVMRYALAVLVAHLEQTLRMEPGKDREIRTGFVLWNLKNASGVSTIPEEAVTALPVRPLSDLIAEEQAKHPPVPLLSPMDRIRRDLQRWQARGGPQHDDEHDDDER